QPVIVDALCRVLVARTSRPGDLLAVIDTIRPRLNDSQARLLHSDLTAAAVSAIDRELQVLNQTANQSAARSADTADRLVSLLLSLERQKLG
ncbi:hypothetical protein ABTB61_19230, partial [Acinetobacter baumannii]